MSKATEGNGPIETLKDEFIKSNVMLTNVLNLNQNKKSSQN